MKMCIYRGPFSYLIQMVRDLYLKNKSVVELGMFVCSQISLQNRMPYTFCVVSNATLNLLLVKWQTLEGK